MWKCFQCQRKWTNKLSNHLLSDDFLTNAKTSSVGFVLISSYTYWHPFSSYIFHSQAVSIFQHEFMELKWNKWKWYKYFQITFEVKQFLPFGISSFIRCSWINPRPSQCSQLSSNRIVIFLFVVYILVVFSIWCGGNHIFSIVNVHSFTLFCSKISKK